jgi:hypothetical protein
LTANNKKFWKNDYIQTIVVLVLVVAIVLGFWYGSQVVLNTKTLPVFVVSTGSMCIPYGGACDGWTHPFDRTIHVGDLIIIQGVDPKALNTDYPNSDIIVFQNPCNPSDVPIVHKITSQIVKDGIIYFFTKGDGNPPTPWPEPVEPYTPDYGWYNPNYYNDHPEIPRGSVNQDLILGKVVMRIPWLGWIAIFMQRFQSSVSPMGFNIGIPIIVLLIVLLIIVEFVLPLVRHKKKPTSTETESANLQGFDQK